MKKILGISIFLVFFSFCSFSFCQAEEAIDRVFYPIFSYQSDRKISAEEATELVVGSRLLRTSKPSHRNGGTYLLKEAFADMLKKNGMEVTDYELISVQGTVYNPNPGDIVIYFTFIKRKTPSQ